MKMVEINKENLFLLEHFIDNIGKAAQSFRYFNTRTTGIIKNHLATILLLEENVPVAYGHLDKENDTVWLGICVIPEFQGRGLGKRMMQILVDKAKYLKLKEISLTVDKTNKPAISLYEKFGFEFEGKAPNYFKYCLRICSES